ncbi:hypothetical protein GCM10009774_04610 [Cellulomonas gelida]|uniref:Uncharacterized protein n=1 Tax=Cellulomonas gelida TaxID=1712 RepID=A0A4Y3KNP4_9CELL|nr:hypothetical protein CGE01nite_29130 [Cellulomonas gelida]GGL17289.1 hypothetical protein GCM10009774_04610 [Cellulomonas gelida]
MTVTLRRARAAVAVLVVAVLAAAGARVAADSAARTSAAWTDDVHATTTVSLGTWSTHALGCVVLAADGSVSGKATCDVLGLRVSKPWDEGAGVGLRGADIRVQVRPQGVNPNAGERLRITVDLSKAPGMPADWKWSTSGASGEFTAADCSALPVMAFTAKDWAGWGQTEIEINLHETRKPGDCSR